MYFIISLHLFSACQNISKMLFLCERMITTVEANKQGYEDELKTSTAHSCNTITISLHSLMQDFIKD